MSCTPALALVVVRRSSYRLLCRSFFFSSRRRHTRCSRDWSSDVCSSDLHAQLADDVGAPVVGGVVGVFQRLFLGLVDAADVADDVAGRVLHGDRKSTRLNSSHGYISYAVFCLKKKKTASGLALRLRRPSVIS